MAFVLDELIVESPIVDEDYAYADTMLVTLRYQVVRYVFEQAAAGGPTMGDLLVGGTMTDWPGLLLGPEDRVTGQSFVLSERTLKTPTVEPSEHHTG